ncbi:MAG TPA: O-antigen ligase family protein [Nitrospiraceae bacterium]|nr:O-antigen ligase family protein [Nitrospiraceae bacterium]
MRFEQQEDFDDAAPPRPRVGLVLGLWLSGVFAASLGGWLNAGHERTAPMVLLGVAVLWPLLYFAMGRCRFFPRSMPLAATGGLILFGGAAALSSFMSPVALLSTGYLVLTLAGIWLALQFNSSLDADQYEHGLKVFALLTATLLVGFAWYEYTPGTRLGNGKDILNPNTIGLVSVSVLLAAMSIKALLFRLAVMGPIAGIIVLTSSRAAAVAAVVGLGMILWLRLRARRRRVLLIAGIGLIFAVVVMMAYGDVMYPILDRSFGLNTADRGIGSGATGRVMAWKGTWEIFVRNPVLGVGFRAHEFLLKADSSSHNGYLATLAEVGMIGFLGVLFLVVRGLRLLWVGSREPGPGFSQSILFGLCVGYLLLAVFERYLINVGNPTSLLFLVGIMRSGALEGSVDELDEFQPESPDELAGREPGERIYGHG